MPRLDVDERHTPDDVVAAFMDAFDDVVVYEPFAGSYLPLEHCGRSIDIPG